MATAVQEWMVRVMTKREYIHLKGIDFISNVNLDEEANEGFMDLIDLIVLHLDKFWDEVEEDDD